MTIDPIAFDGGCTCRHIRYRCVAKPIIVHCCHCRWCQRETGASFALNAVIESENVQLLEGEIDLVPTPSQSGNGQKVARCPHCRVAVWSHYFQSGPAFRFLRVGTLDQPDSFPPDIHIFTASKQPWVVLPSGARAVPEFYNPQEVWSKESLTRFLQAKSRAQTP